MLVGLKRLNLLTGHVVAARQQPRKFSTNFNQKDTVNVFNAGACMIPHAQKRHKGGEDAYVCTKRFLAVADGVGGWAEQGIDPANYSRALCLGMEELAGRQDDRYKHNPKEVMISVVGDISSIVGSSTCVTAAIDESAPLLYAANLGDSGYMLLRKNGLDLDIVFRTEEQQHSFNFPYQVGTGGDDPTKADDKVHEVLDNDILILGSDGLFDNLYNDMIIESVKPFVRDRPELLEPSIVAE